MVLVCGAQGWPLGTSRRALILGLCLATSLGWAGEPTPAYVHLTSDCLVLSLRPSLIDSVGAVPEAVKLPSGQDTYTLSLQVGQQFYRFCYPTAKARDEALALVKDRLEGR